MSFNQRKKDILEKKDKSSIGGWDEKINDLCESINKSEKYYTTSSCSGRIIVMIDQAKKGPGLFEFVSHDLIEKFPEVDLSLKLKFKQEPPIIHVACEDLESAEELLNKFRDSGWKRSGIISLGKNIIVEALSTEKIEFPLTLDGKVLVSDEFLEIVLSRANENLEKGWEKINKVKNSL